MKNIYEKRINDFDIEPFLMLRTPLLPYKNWESGLVAILKNKVFMAALKNASPDLYDCILKNGTQLSSLTVKALTSLQKYHNRICYRTTPFGLFSGFSLIGWSDLPICLSAMEDYIIHARPDFAEQMFRPYGSLLEESFVVNPTLYKVGNSVRFFTAETKSGKNKMLYAVRAVELTDWLSRLLQLCNTMVPYGCIKDFMINEKLVNAGKVKDAIQELLEEQLLLSSSFPGITEHHNQYVNKQHKVFTCSSVPKLEKISPIESLYLNTEKKFISGGLPAHFKEDIKNGLYIGSLFSGTQSPPDLLKFRDAYTKKFENRCIPLLQAIDPETGVGYGGLFQNGDVPVLMDALELQKTKQEISAIALEKFQQIVLDKWVQGKNKNEIRLEKTDFDYGKNEAETLSESSNWPTGYSVLFRITHDGMLYLQHGGGINPISLIGRFTLFNEKIADFAEKMAEKEAGCNPDVIFADIVHLSGSHTANIETRKCSRAYEIQLVCGTHIDEEHRIPVSDLWIGVRDGLVIIWSEKLQKRVIPRLDSAYNYTISDLPLFRFLCDLQYQNIRSNFSFSLSNLLTGLSHYPRVSYENTVLCLEEWSLSKVQWQACVIDSQIDELSEWLKEKGIPDLFAVTQGDRQVIINSNERKDLKLLQTIFKSAVPEYINIQEFPFARAGNTYCAKDVHGNEFVSEYIAFLTNSRQVYSGYPFPEKEQDYGLKRMNTVMDGWVYYKIFCIENSANEILASSIAPLSELLSEKAAVLNWFFVRYHEEGRYHLRLRFQVASGQSLYVIHQTEQYLCPLMDSGVVTDFSLHIYERELERYGISMEETERFFGISSRFVTSFLKNTNLTEADPYYYTLIFNSVDWITDSFGWSLQQKISFHQSAYESFRIEQGLPYHIYKKNQEKYRLFSEIKGMFGANQVLRHLQNSINDFKNELADLHFHNTKENELTGSLIHMHLNRFFVDNFRYQEMVVHYILFKHYTSVMAREEREKKKMQSP